MSDIAFPWTTLRRSELARRIMAGGMVLTVSAFVIACLSTLNAPVPGRVLAAAASFIALVAGWLEWRRAAAPLQLRVTRDAEILVRAGDTAEPQSLQVRFVAPWLIVLAGGRMFVPVWPDCLGANEYRRLAVACRWRRPVATA